VPAADSIRELDLELDPSWAIGGRPHGGYLARLLAESALDETHPDPMAVSVHFLSPPEPGAATVASTRLRSGRRVSTTRCQLIEGGEPRAEALVTAGRVEPPGEARLATPPPPSPPAPEGLFRAPSEGGPFRVGHLDHVDLRMDPETAGWAVGQPAGRAEYRAWMRRDDGADPSLLDLLVFADAMPPTTFDVGILGWVPTLELTVLLRAQPAPGWVLVRQRSRLISDGWLDEDCEIWDSTGALVAQGRQLAGYREA
jgi:acyl-CoA thioesterase